MEEQIQRPQVQFTNHQIGVLLDQFGTVTIERVKDQTFVQAGTTHKQAGETLEQAVNNVYEWVKEETVGV